MLAYPKSLKKLSLVKIPESKAFIDCLAEVQCQDGFICTTCLRYLKIKRVPPCAIANGMKFPEIPCELQDIFQLEWRLLSPRIAFMKIISAPRGGQKKIRGNVVNVAADTISTLSSLPRMHNDDDIITVKLK